MSGGIRNGTKIEVLYTQEELNKAIQNERDMWLELCNLLKSNPYIDINKWMCRSHKKER